MGDRLTGIGVSAGIACGPVARLGRPTQVPRGRPPSRDPAGEAEAVRTALDEVHQELAARAAGAQGTAADVLTATALFAADPALAQAAIARTSTGSSAVDAVIDASADFRAALVAGGPYLAERVRDLDDVRDRVVARLLDVPMPGIPDPGHPFILVADDLAPADTALLDPANVLALVTQEGGATSHTAILAGSLGLPAVVGCVGADTLRDGARVLVDGDAGTVTVDPDDDDVRTAAAADARRRALVAGSTGPGRTADGAEVALLVNLGGTRELPAAAAADAEGVGLFRTEFLFLDREVAPDRREQEQAYGDVFTAFAGRRVVVRTLDAGADKPLRFATAPDEPNPALGVRGLRTARRLPELHADQLAAIAAAAVRTGADVRVMAPMVATPAEAADFVAQANAAGLTTVGVMVEVPAAALCAERIARAAQFLSIGSNDLSQYAFAADRLLSELSHLLDPWQPALLDLIQRTTTGAAVHDRPVGVCGEAAGNPLLAPVLVGLGVSSLSMSPASLAPVRASLARVTLAQCQEAAVAALEADSPALARAAADAVLGHEGGR